MTPRDALPPVVIDRVLRYYDHKRLDQALPITSMDG
jgi:hypothetical protein